MIYTGIKDFKKMIADNDVSQMFAITEDDRTFVRYYSGYAGFYAVKWSVRKATITVHAYQVDAKTYADAKDTYYKQVINARKYNLFYQASANVCTIIGYGQLDQPVSDDQKIFYKKYRELLQFQMTDDLSRII